MVTLVMAEGMGVGYLGTNNQAARGQQQLEGDQNNQQKCKQQQKHW